jgi:hypothetical protein
MESYLRADLDFGALAERFRGAKPFHHIVIDDFFLPEIARQLAAEVPTADSAVWREYNNQIEVKRVCNHWDRFPATTYCVMTFLHSAPFVQQLSVLSGASLTADMGLNGAGWHSHSRGGKLNCHLDYSIHPKLGKERKLNLIVYLTPDWQPEWRGALGLWEGDDTGPSGLASQVDCLFNRAVIFDTTQCSWHGLPDPIQCPAGATRNSIATYYLCEPQSCTPTRGRALFAPTQQQEADPEVLELIAQRSKHGGVFATGT